MSEVIDTLAIEIAANDSFTAVAKPLLSLLERLEEAVNKNTEALGDYEKATEGTAKSTEKVNAAQDKSEKSAKKSTKALKEQEKQVKKNEKAAKNLLQAIGGFTKAIGALGTMIFAGVGLDRLAQEAAKTNKELDVTSKNLGMTSQSLATWRGAAELSGGSAQGLTGYLNNLSAVLTRLTVQGDASITQFFNALGINLLDGSQKAKKLEDIMLELADKFSTMDRVKAFGIAQQMGIDEGTFEMLAQGRQSLEEHLQKTAKIYKSNQQDLETARKLTAATAYLNQQFDGLKLMIANAVAPVLLKIVEITSNFFDFLQRNENLVKGVFFGIAGGITAVLIPTLWAGATAAAAFIAPFLPAILIVAGLALAFGLLYDDYKKWAEGGISLFNWGNFIKWFEKANLSIDNLKNAFARLVTGYESWDEAVNAGKAWLKSKGFIDENGVSLDSLANGFKNLVTDIKNAVIPALKKVWEIIEAVLDGEFSKAIELAVSAVGDTWEFVKEETKDTIVGDIVDGIDKNLGVIKKLATDEKFTFGDAVSEMTDNTIDAVGKAGKRVIIKGAEVIDTAFGIDPDKDDFSLTQMVEKENVADSQKGFSQNSVTNYSGEMTVKDLNQDETAALVNKVISKESGGKLDAVNSFGYLGLYQFGAEALADIGLIDRKKFDAMKVKHGKKFSSGKDAELHKSFLEDESNWTIQGGQKSFLQNKKVQDEAMIKLLNKNAQYLGKTYQGDSQHKSGLLMASHLKGWSAAKKYAEKGIDSTDGYGTSVSSYYNAGKKAVANIKSNQQNTKIDPNRPIGGYAVASALQANQHHLSTMQNLAQPQSVSNNSKTEVAFNGGIHINSTANTLSGTAGDFVKGVNNHGASAFQFVNGVS
ncbi:peptidoglycan-binding protein LysM [Ursidibacter arcticus]